LSTEPISLGALPEPGVTVNEIALDGHSATGLRGDLVILDGGAAVAWPWLRWSPEAPEGDTIETPLSGLTTAADVVRDERSDWPLVVDGTDLVAWVCPDGGDCPTQAPGRLAVSGDGPLVRGLAHAGYLFLASEGTSPALHVLSAPSIDATTGEVVPACSGEVATLGLGLPAGTRVLEVLLGYPAEVAVLTDRVSDAVVVVDVSNPAAPTIARSIDIGGATAPVWGRWERGELLLARVGGAAEIWRWADGSLVLRAAWQPVGSAARAAARMGDQLWIGLADGRLQQVDLLDPALPRLVGEMSVGAGVVAMSDLGRSLLVATTSSLLHVWARVMPPEINPGEVTWGHRAGLSWARVEVTSYEELDETTVAWGELEGTYDWSTSLYTVDQEILTPPTIRATDENGVPGGPYTPGDWQTWGDWLAARSEWFPGGAGLAPATCDAYRTTAGLAQQGEDAIPWVASAVPMSSAVDLVFTPAGSGSWNMPSATSAIAATGPVAELISFGNTLLVLDDGLGVWDLTDPAVPVLLSHTELFGGDVVAAAEIDTGSWPPLAVAAAADPLRLAAIGVDDPQQPMVGGEATLPAVSGAVIDLARAHGSEVVVLLDGGADRRLIRVDLADPQAPAVLAEIVLQPGAAPIAVTAHCNGDWSGCGSGSFVAVVREGWGVEVYALSDLALLHVVPLSGAARDVMTTWDDVGGVHLLVTLGFGHGVASITDLPGPPSVTDLHVPGAPTAFVHHDSGRSGLDPVAIATPTGIVNLSLPAGQPGT